MAEQQRLIRYAKLGPLEARYFGTAVEALRRLIARTDTVSWGGSLTFDDVGGLTALVREKGYRVIDRDEAKDAAERDRLRREAFSCDTFLTGTNAISEDSRLVNIDGVGNRVAAMAYEPRQVIVISGMNKVVKTLDDALTRARRLPRREHAPAAARRNRFVLIE